MASKQSQYHILRITLYVRKVALAVRFPCSLQFQIKNDMNVTQSRLAYELRDGKCEPNEKLTMDVEIPVKNSEYSEKKISLIILMASSNGKIPAGTVQLKITDKGKIIEGAGNGNNLQNYAIQKCPDKSATIDLTLKVEYIRSFTRSSQQQIGQMARSQSPNSNIYSGKKIITSSYNTLAHHTSYDKIFVQNSRQRAERVRKAHSPQSGHTKNYLQQSPKLILSKKRSDSGSNRSGSLIDQQLLQVNQETQQYYHRKIRKVEKQKQSYIKQISKLKAEIHSIRRQQQWRNGTSQDQISKYRNEIDILTHQLTQAKEKLKSLQRKQKQFTNLNRDLKQQLQKHKSKNSVLQTSHEESKLVLEQKQKLVKKLSQQIKQLKEQLQDIRISSSMQEKRIEYKETTYKEQIKKLTQKYQQSESQRQKSTLEINNMLGQFQSNEKKTQLQAKEKERAFLDEKNKMSKKIQALSLENSQITEQNNQLKTLVEQLNVQVSLITKNKEELILQLKQGEQKYEYAITISKKQEITISQMTRQIQELEVHQRQLTILNKKHMELTSQNNKNIEQVSRLTQKGDAFQKSIKDLESTLKETNSVKDANNIKITELNKQMQKLKKSLQIKQAQVSNLAQNINTLNTKLSQSKMKLDTEKMQSENSRNKSQSQILYLIRTKDHLQSELQQQKWKYSRSQQLNNSNVAKITSLNQKLLKINQQLINEQQRSKQIRQAIKEQEAKTESAHNQLLSKETKQKQLHTTIKTKTELEYSLRKTIKQKEQQIFLLKDKEKQLEAAISEKSQLIETINKQKQQHGQAMNKQIVKLKSQLDALLKGKEDSAKKANKQEEEIEYYKNSASEMKKTISAKEAELEGRDKKIAELEQKLSQSIKKQEYHRNKATSKDQQLNRVRQEWQKYKQQTNVAMEQFINEVNRDTTATTSTSTTTTNNLNGSQSQKQSQTTLATSVSNSQIQLISFPDQSLSLLQIQAMKKHHEILMRYRQEINAQKQELTLLAVELNRYKEYSKQRELQLQSQILVQKQRYRVSISDNLSQKNAILQRLHNSDEKLHEMEVEYEKSQQQLRRAKQEYEQMDKHVQQQNEEKQRLQERIRQARKQIQAINAASAYNKNTSQGELLSTIEQNKAQIDKHKANVKELEKKLSASAKTVQESEEYINKIEQELSELVHSKEKLEKKVEFVESKCKELQESKKNIQNQLYAYERKLKQELLSKQKLSEELRGQRYRVEDLSIKNNKLKEDIETISTSKAKLEIQIQQFMVNSLQNDINSKKVEHTFKHTNEKANQTIKQLQQQIIILTSEVELKNFLIQQLEIVNQELKSTTIEQYNESSQKRTAMIKLQEQSQNLKNENIFLHQNYESLNVDKQSLEVEVKKLRQAMESMTNQIMENSVLGELLNTKEKDYDRLRDEYEHMEGRLDTNIRQLKLQVSDLKRQIAVKSTREEELKRKIRQLEKQLSHRTHELENQAIKNKDDLDRQRLELVRSLDMIESQNGRLKSECEYLREHAARQIQQANQQCAELARLLTEKQQMLVNKSDQVKQNERKIKMLSGELKSCLEAWDKEKIAARTKGGAEVAIEIGSMNRFQRTIDDINSRSRNLENKAKRNGNEVQPVGK